VDSLEAALAAEAAGAGRLELCGDLDIGGITPPLALQRQAQRRVRIPRFVMVRPRGGSFVHTPAEVESMLTDIARARELGASGIVTGVLDDRGAIEVAVMRRLIAAARPLPVTFHKAFDTLADLPGALELLAGVGVDRVLTSGGARAAAAGSAAIAALVRQAGSRMSIVAGGSVCGESVAALVR
jgi:copper homeostasis protein